MSTPAPRYSLNWYQLSDLLDAAERERDERLTLEESSRLARRFDDAEERAERYRLAWMSAYWRAAGRRYDLLKQVGVAGARLIALDEMTQQRDEARDAADGYAAANQRIEDHLVAAIAERDEARAEAEAERTEARRAQARANEAARLSADARDDAEARDEVIADLREQLGIVEGDRLNVMAWVVNTSIEFGLGDDPALWLPDIAAYMREQRDAIAARLDDTQREAGSEADRLRGVLREIAAYVDERRHAFDEGGGLAQHTFAKVIDMASAEAAR